MILTFAADDKKLDIIVKPEQKPEEVYRRLCENGYFEEVCRESRIRIYSVRQKAYLDPGFTFREGEIREGDILLVLSSGSKGERA